jgi:hypothetical protein
MRSFLMLGVIFLVSCSADMNQKNINPADDIEVMAITEDGYDIKWTRDEVKSTDGNTHKVFERRIIVKKPEFEVMRRKQPNVGDHYILHDGELKKIDEIPMKTITIPGPSGK